MGSGRGREERDVLGLPSQRVWVVCLCLGFLIALVHLTATHSSVLLMSVRGWSSSPKISSLVNSDEELKEVEMDKQNSSLSNFRGRAQPRIAICLVGGARSFELTGLSIKQHLLDVFNNSDVFLHVPLDDDAHKLTLLGGASRLAMARVFENGHMPESWEAQELLTRANSPNGIQGLLQYFRLVEGCLTMISSFEIKHGFQYDWIIRTRVDGYWSGPLPPLGTLNPRYYHVPYGSSYGGLNDRLGVGTRNTSWPALSRLSLIPKLHGQGYRGLNSERAFKHQMDCSDVEVKFQDFPFCILTSRKYAWPLDQWGVPVASIKSKGALNGAKCKPCHSVARGEAAIQAVHALDPGWGWIHPVKDLQLCDSRKDAEPGWEGIFDKISGPELASVRKKMVNRTEKECIQEVRQFGESWEDWDAPTAETLCRRHVEPNTNHTTNSTVPEG